MAALTALGETWNGSSSLWDAFRALGILQGVWAGSAEGSVKLSDMLQPGRLRTCAEGNISDPRLRDWSIAVIRNWEEKLSEGFPGKTANDAVVLAADVRNVLHGVGNLGQDRARRLRTLRAIADSDARLQLIADIAALWWTAAMFAPAKAYRAGRPPWAS
jgi:hypothetical protein